MSFVVVTIRDELGESRDLELPADIPVSNLEPATAQAVHHPDLSTDDAPVKAVFKIEGMHEVIPLDKSLEAVGIVYREILLCMAFGATRNAHRPLTWRRDPSWRYHPVLYKGRSGRGSYPR